MKKNLYILLCLPMSVLLMACPYKSKLPIDETHTADQRMAGTWYNFASPNKTYAIIADKTHQYRIVERNQRENGVSETMYYGSISTVSGALFLNVYDTSADEKSYYIYRIEDLTASKLVLLPLDERFPPKMDKKGELKAWLAANKDRPSFFSWDDLAVYLKR